MTIHTPFHLQRLLALDPIHGFDRAVALLTFKTRFYVPFVSEMYEIGDVVNLDPGYGLAFIPVTKNLLDLGFVRCNGPMTSDTFADTRNARRWRTIRVGMTHHARNLVVSGVDPVAEFYGLYGSSVGVNGAVYYSSQ